MFPPLFLFLVAGTEDGWLAFFTLRGGEEWMAGFFALAIFSFVFLLALLARFLFTWRGSCHSVSLGTLRVFELLFLGVIASQNSLFWWVSGVGLVVGCTVEALGRGTGVVGANVVGSRVIGADVVGATEGATRLGPRVITGACKGGANVGVSV